MARRDMTRFTCLGFKMFIYLIASRCSELFRRTTDLARFRLRQQLEAAYSTIFMDGMRLAPETSTAPTRQKHILFWRMMRGNYYQALYFAATRRRDFTLRGDGRAIRGMMPGRRSSLEFWRQYLRRPFLDFITVRRR